MAGRKKQRKSKQKIRTQTERNRRRTKAFKVRSVAAKKGWVTRRTNAILRVQGIELERSWEGKSRDGSSTGYHYERYHLPLLNPTYVENIIEYVKKRNPDRPFLVSGQVDFTDSNDRLFTNNSSQNSYNQSNIGAIVVEGIRDKHKNNSNPFIQQGRSSKVDVEGNYVLIRFKREAFASVQKRNKANAKHRAK